MSYNTPIVEDLRANGGHVSGGFFAGKPLLILTTRGARSGAERVAPVIYSRDGDRFVIVASKGGAPTHPAWYHNLLANPEVTVEVEGERFAAHARVVDDPDERRRLYAQQVAILPSFAEYERRTDRLIPVVVLERT